MLKSAAADSKVFVLNFGYLTEKNCYPKHKT